MTDQMKLPDGTILGQSGQYCEANGVKTYYEIHGSGEPLVIMHGGLATLESLYFLIADLSQYFKVIAFERRGHGRTPDINGPITYELMRDDSLALLDALKINKAHCLGWSDGGVVALMMAVKHLDCFSHLILLGTNHTSKGAAAHILAEFKGATADNMPPMVAETWKQTSPNGADHWPELFAKIKKMWLSDFGILDNDLKKVQTPTLVMLADHDAVTIDDNHALFELLPNAQLCVIPGATHMVAFEEPQLVNLFVRRFLLPKDKANKQFGVFDAGQRSK